MVHSTVGESHGRSRSTGGVLGIPLLITLSAIWRGYVLSILWGWFVVPTFHLPQLSIVAAIGIAMVVSYLTHQTSMGKDEREGWDAFGYTKAITIINPLIALFFGWIVHLFM